MNIEWAQTAGAFVGGLLLSGLSAWKMKRSSDERIVDLEDTVKAALKRLDEIPDRTDELAEDIRMNLHKINGLRESAEQDRDFVERKFRELRQKIHEAHQSLVEMEQHFSRARTSPPSSPS